jgi:glycosyltransferase involved in cell wall biosynthesis
MPRILGKTKLRLLVVGEFYGDEDVYRKQVSDLSLEQNVSVYSEYVRNEDVGMYFSACDVVVLPYVSATQSGIVQIAYQFDKPVIATGVGGLAEVVLDKKTGFIVPPENPNALADAVVRFYKEKRELLFRANVLKEKKKYSWNTLVKVIEQLAESGK